MVELTDVVFAVDSIPAILAVTRDPFLVFTSNAFAILGLRSLYFAVAGLMAMFRYLKYSLVLILAFVGVKMLLVSHYHVPNLVSLGIILGTLAGGVVASLWAARREAQRQRGRRTEEVPLVGIRAGKCPAGRRETSLRGVYPSDWTILEPGVDTLTGPSRGEGSCPTSVAFSVAVQSPALQRYPQRSDHPLGGPAQAPSVRPADDAVARSVRPRRAVPGGGRAHPGG